ncbi:MAG: acyltransferase [Gemmatimonadaceae bacterium]
MSEARDGDGALVRGRLGHSPVLDGVRGLAIVLVFLVHFKFRTWSTPLDAFVDGIFRSGWMGVDLFFVLSGFLITGILLEGRSGPRYFRNFYLRRLLRLFPVYYLTLAVLFLVLPRVLQPPPAELVALVPHQGWYWLYAVNVFQVRSHGTMSYFNTLHLWSLSVEEQFYLLWPMVVRLTTASSLLVTCVIAIVAAFAIRVGLIASGGSAWAAYSLMPARMDALAVGACVAILARDTAGSARLRRWWRPVALVALAGVLGLIVWKRQYHEDDLAVLTLGYVLNALVFGAGLTGILDSPTLAIFRPFHWRWLQWIGKVSYGAYVYHLLLQLAVDPAKEYFRKLPPVLGSQLPAEFVWIILMTSVTLAVAWVSYRWIEMPFLALKDRLAPPTRA